MMAKKLNFTGATVGTHGMRYRDLPDGGRHVIERDWSVILATGEHYHTKAYPRYGSREWQKLCTPGPGVYQSQHWRRAAKGEAEQVEAFVVAHPDYLPDDMIEPPAAKAGDA